MSFFLFFRQEYGSRFGSREKWWLSAVVCVGCVCCGTTGFVHTAFSFRAESATNFGNADAHAMPPGALISFVQKGLQYVEIEAHLNEVWTLRFHRLCRQIVLTDCHLP